MRHDPGVLRLQVINSTDHLTSSVIFVWVQSPLFSLRALHSSYGSSYTWLEGSHDFQVCLTGPRIRRECTLPSKLACHVGKMPSQNPETPTFSRGTSDDSASKTAAGTSGKGRKSLVTKTAEDHEITQPLAGKGANGTLEEEQEGEQMMNATAASQPLI